MNRRKFFKGIGSVIATTVIAPHVILAENNSVEVFTEGNGLWQQLRRGKIIKYGKPNGITKAQIKEAVEYVFRDYENRPQRFLRFETCTKGREEIRKKMHSYIINGVTYTT